jgi:hypothetical protein
MLSVQCNTSPGAIHAQLNDDAYQIFQIVSGTGFVFLENQVSFLVAGDLVFIKPGSRWIWSLSDKVTLHYCHIPPQFLAPHVTRLFKQDPVFNYRKVVRNLPHGQADTIGALFEMIRQEERGGYEDKKDAILIHLQLLLLLAQRVFIK